MFQSSRTREKNLKNFKIHKQIDSDTSFEISFHSVTIRRHSSLCTTIQQNPMVLNQTYYPTRFHNMRLYGDNLNKFFVYSMKLWTGDH